MPSPAAFFATTQAEPQIPLRPPSWLAFVVTAMQLATAQQTTSGPSFFG